MSAQAGQFMGMCLIFAETGQRMSCFPFKQRLHWKSAHVLVQFVRFLHHLTVVVVMVLVIVNVLIVLHPCPPRRRPHFCRPCPRRGCCCFCNRCQARRSIKNKETKNWRIRGVGCECGSICIYMHLYCFRNMPWWTVGVWSLRSLYVKLCCFPCHDVIWKETCSWSCNSKFQARCKRVCVQVHLQMCSSSSIAHERSWQQHNAAITSFLRRTPGLQETDCIGLHRIVRLARQVWRMWVSARISSKPSAVGRSGG